MTFTNLLSGAVVAALLTTASCSSNEEQMEVQEINAEDFEDSAELTEVPGAEAPEQLDQATSELTGLPEDPGASADPEIDLGLDQEAAALGAAIPPGDPGGPLETPDAQHGLDDWPDTTAAQCTLHRAR